MTWKLQDHKAAARGAYNLIRSGASLRDHRQDRASSRQRLPFLNLVDQPREAVCDWRASFLNLVDQPCEAVCDWRALSNDELAILMRHDNHAPCPPYLTTSEQHSGEPFDPAVADGPNLYPPNHPFTPAAKKLADSRREYDRATDLSAS